jgi:hypothetical protein
MVFDESAEPPPSPEQGRGRVELDELVIFPLPETVFFPHTVIPLHIFEMRYRAMTEDLLADDRPLAIALIDEGAGTDERGRPRVHDIVGFGHIIRHDRLEDGRFNILLRGEGRARILTEHDTDRPYRVVCAETVVDRPAERAEIARRVETVRGCIVGLRAFNERLSVALTRALNAAAQPEQLSHSLCSALFPDTTTRQRLLAERDVLARLDAISERLTELLMAGHEQLHGDGAAD